MAAPRITPLRISVGTAEAVTVEGVTRGTVWRIHSSTGAVVDVFMSDEMAAEVAYATLVEHAKPDEDRRIADTPT